MIRHLAAHGPETSAFWEGAKRGELMLPFCADERRWLWPPASFCPGCGGAVDWIQHDGAGLVVGHTVVHRAPDPTLAGEVPYVVALIALAPSVQLLANIVDTAPEAVHAGLPVRVGFRPVEGGVAIPVFVADESEPKGGRNASC